MSVRVRIAPSPTGDPHVGTAYIALFNLAFARSQGGKFILRIEDTDRVRSTGASEQAILDSLRWMGLNWDEGPDVGGSFGPYRQSERGELYGQYAQKLLDSGHAFKCYRTSEELDQLRAERREQGIQKAFKQSDLELSAEEVARREAAGDPYVIRMCVPDEGVCRIKDRLRGEIELDWANVDAQVLLKADGMPTYHLANVVDDHLMEITHVIRGEEWINSAPKHQLLYEYLGWEMPELCHMPLLRNPDKSKLSKRKNPTSINYYRAMGYMPEALTNYLGRMGWSMPDESEKFTLESMIAHFDLDKVSLGGPVFDVEKLDWLNGFWIREDLDEAQFAARVADWAVNPDYLGKIIPLIKDRVEKFTDIAPLTGLFFNGLPVLDEAEFDALKLDRDTQVKILQFASWWLDAQASWERDDLYQGLNELAQGMDIKLREFLQPLFIAMSGSRVCPPLFDAMTIIGADITRARVRHALNFLGGVSKKQAKKLEKEYRDLIPQAT
jgi:glutamyl-tRNA synthetase